MYPCTRCGCCCRRIGKVAEAFPRLFPHKVDENGACEMLENNECKIYDNRPVVCNIKEMWKLMGFKEGEFSKENSEECNRMMEEDNVNPSFRIKNK